MQHGESAMAGIVPAALKRVEAASYLNISPSTFHRIGPPADISRGRIRLWKIETLDNWLDKGPDPKKKKK